MKPNVAYPGPIGTFSQRAARLFGKGFPCTSFDEVAERVQNGSIANGVLALSNNYAGVVTPTLKAIRSHEVVATGLAQIRIRLCVARHPQNTSSTKSLRSHPHALAQAQDFIREHDYIPMPSSTTARAAWEVANTHQDSAALCAPEAAALYNLEVVNDNVSDHDDAITTFVRLENIRRSAKRRLLVTAKLSDELSLWHSLSEGTSLVSCSSRCVLEEDNVVFDLGGFSRIRRGPYC